MRPGQEPGYRLTREGRRVQRQMAMSDSEFALVLGAMQGTGDTRRQAKLPRLLTLEATGRLAEEHSAYFTLSWDIERVGILLRHAQRRVEGPTTEIDEAAWEAAAVRYARCFLSGARKGFVRSVVIPSPMRKGHDWFIAARNELITHADRDSELDVTRTLLVIDPDGDEGDRPTRPVGVTAHNQSLALPGADDLGRLVLLADEVKRQLDELRLAVAEKILSSVLAGRDLRRVVEARGTVRVDDEL